MELWRSRILECAFRNCHIALRIACHSYETICMAIYMCIHYRWKCHCGYLTKSIACSTHEHYQYSLVSKCPSIGGAKPRIRTHEEP